MGDLAAFTPRSTRGTYVVAPGAHGEVRYFKLRLSTFKHSVDVPKAQLAVPGKRCGAAELQQVVELTPLFSWPRPRPPQLIEQGLALFQIERVSIFRY